MKLTLNLTLIFLVSLFFSVEARRYKAHDRIGLVANTVGPFNNPTETYSVSPYIFFAAILLILLDHILTVYNIYSIFIYIIYFYFISKSIY